MTAKPRPQDDIAIGRMCAWLKKNKMVGQTTLAGKLTLTPAEEAYTAMMFGEKLDGSASGVKKRV